MAKEFRNLKIHTKYQTRKFGESKIPEIRLKGKWLESLGFKRGETVKIKQQKNKLTITVLKEQKIIVMLPQAYASDRPEGDAQKCLPAAGAALKSSVGI